MPPLHRPAEPPAGSAPAPLTSLSLVKAMGAELARPLHQMSRILRELRGGRLMRPDDLAQLEQALEQARGLAIAGQQLARLGSPLSPATLERLHLDSAIQDALEEARPRLQARGIETRQRLRPVEIRAEPSRLALLLDAAIEWMAAHGHRLMVTLGRRAWPDHALVVLRCGAPESGAASSLHAPGDAAERVAAAGTSPATDTLAWHRLVLLAQALDVQPQRSLLPGGAVLTLEFLDTVPLPAHMTTLELEIGAGGAGGAEGEGPWVASQATARARLAAGVRHTAPYLLLVSEDVSLRTLVEAVCRPLHLPVEVADTPLRAQWACARARPVVLVVDDAVHDDALEALLAELHVGTPRPQVIEIGSGSEGAEMLALSEWSLDEAHRISREAAARQLPLLLGEIWPERR